MENEMQELWYLMLDHRLYGGELKKLVMLNKRFYNTVKPTLERFYHFRIPKEKKITLMKPAMVTVYSENSIPPSAKRLFLEISSLSFNSNIFPPLTHLSFGYKFNSPVDNILPLSLTHLTFGIGFNHPIDHLPPSLLHLIFCTTSNFQQELNNLPPSITKLLMGVKFISPIIFPLSLTTLRISVHNHWFDFPPSLTSLTISGLGLPHTASLDTFPPFLTHLEFKIDATLFNQPTGIYSISNLPPTLTHFFPSNQIFNPNNLPHGLRYLTIGNTFNLPIDYLPLSLTHLEFEPYSNFNQSIDNLPPSLLSLKLPDRFNHSVDKLPLSLTYLELSALLNHTLDNLPPSLTELIFSNLGDFDHFDKTLNDLPNSLTRLILPTYFLKPLLSFPSSLTHLEFGVYDKHLPPLPPTLTHLSFESRYNQPNPPFPPSLIYLAVGDNFDQILPPLPELTHLILGRSFHQILDPVPPNLTRLIIYYKLPLNLPSSVHATLLSPDHQIRLPPDPPASIFRKPDCIIN